MALVRCPDCNRDVSDVAPVCPGCGRPIASSAAPRPPAQADAAAQAQATPGQVVALVAVLGFLGYGAYSCYSCYSAVKTSPAEQRAKDQAAEQADANYSRSKAAFEQSQPSTIADARKVIGDDPLTCDHVKFTCRWVFYGKVNHEIRVFADGTRNGSVVNHVEYQ